MIHTVQNAHTAVGEPGSAENGDLHHQSFRKRQEGRSWSQGRFEASSSSEPGLTPVGAELVMKGGRLLRAGLVPFRELL